MKKLKIVLFSLVFISLISLNCAPKPEGKSQEIPSAKTSTEELARPIKENWSEQSIGLRKAEEKEWEKTQAEAKKEKKVVIYSSMGPQARAGLSKVFKERFGLELDVIIGTGREIDARVFTLRRGGIYDVDIIITGSGTIYNSFILRGVVQPISPLLLLPEVIQPKSWLEGDIRYYDKDKRALVFQAFPSNPFVVNTSLVGTEEVKSYGEMANPKWKGKVVMSDPTTDMFPLNVFRVMGFHFLGLDYWRQMVKQELAIIRDRRQIVEWVSKGKYPIGLTPSTDFIIEYQQAGAPIRRVISDKEPTQNTGSGIMVYMDNPPHPNAAKIFINWFLTKEGLTIYSRTQGLQSLRKDVSTDHLAPEDILRPGVKYFQEDDVEWALKRDEHLEAAKEIFAPLLK